MKATRLGADAPTTPPEILESLVSDFLAERNRRVLALAPLGSRAPVSCPEATATGVGARSEAVCSALAETETWKYAVKKGIPVKRNGENIRYMLTEARKIPHLRDIVSGLLTPVIAAQLRPVAEMFLREIEAEGDYFQKDRGSRVCRSLMHPDGSHHMPTPRAASRPCG